MHDCLSQDGYLTLSEMLDKLDYIKTSTITDYGAMTFEGHDELWCHLSRYKLCDDA